MTRRTGGAGFARRPEVSLRPGRTRRSCLSGRTLRAPFSWRADWPHSTRFSRRARRAGWPLWSGGADLTLASSEHQNAADGGHQRNSHEHSHHL